MDGTDLAACAPDAVDEPKYMVSPYPGPEYLLPKGLAELVLAFERETGCSLWFLCQNGNSVYDFLGEEVADVFLAARREFSCTKQVALLIDSPGGMAKQAYRAARALSKHGGFTAVVPRFAKSAATLLALAAHSIVLGEYAELGPLDVQILDPERERRGSALDEVQSVERLHAASMDALDQVMFLLVRRTRKRTDVLLPMVLTFIAEMMRPLLDKIDAVHYTEVSRWLKEGEEYAVRCLDLAGYAAEKANNIAAHLVNGYPAHDFLIGSEEAREIGLKVVQAPQAVARIVEEMVPFLRSMSAVGVMKEVTPDGDTQSEEHQADGGECEADGGERCVA